MGIRTHSNIRIRRQSSGTAASPVSVPTFAGHLRDLRQRGKAYDIPVLRSKEHKKEVENHPEGDLMGSEILNGGYTLVPPAGISNDNFFRRAMELGRQLADDKSLNCRGPNDISYELRRTGIAVELHAERPNREYVLILMLEQLSGDRNPKSELVYSLLLMNEPKLPTDAEFLRAQELFLDFLDQVADSFS